MHSHYFTYFRLPVWKKIGGGKVSVYMFQLFPPPLSLSYTIHILTYTVHISTYLNKGKAVVHIMSYHHVISGYFISSAVHMKGDTTDLNMILYRKH